METTGLFQSSNQTLSSLSDNSIQGTNQVSAVINILQQYVHLYVLVNVNAVLGVLGTVANIINIVVFTIQGFNTSFNMSLLVLAVADLGSLVSLTVQSFYFSYFLRHYDFTFLSSDIVYLLAAVFRGSFVRIAWWITTLISFERCLCITMPLKVKQIVTPRSTTCVLLLMVFIPLTGLYPVLIGRRIGNVSIKNITVTGFYYAENGQFLNKISEIFSVVMQFGSYIINTICATIIIIQLNLDSKWRNQSSSIKLANGRASRDKRITKMVAFISSIFVICSLASCISYILVVAHLPGYSNKFTDTTYLTVREFTISLEAINSSVNNFVYYFMSSKYMAVFNQIFCRS